MSVRSSVELCDRLADVPTALPVEYIPTGPFPEWLAVWREEGEVKSLFLGEDVDGRIAVRIERQKREMSTQDRRHVEHITLRQMRMARVRTSYQRVKQKPQPETWQTHCTAHTTFEFICDDCRWIMRRVQRIRQASKEKESVAV